MLISHARTACAEAADTTADGLSFLHLHVLAGAGPMTVVSHYDVVDRDPNTGRFGAGKLDMRRSGFAPFFEIGGGVRIIPARLTVGLSYGRTSLGPGGPTNPIAGQLGLEIASTEVVLITPFVDFAFHTPGIHLGGAVGYAGEKSEISSPSFTPRSSSRGDSGALTAWVGYKAGVLGGLGLDVSIQVWSLGWSGVFIGSAPWLGYGSTGRLALCWY
jgi:hypothetical protein